MTRRKLEDKNIRKLIKSGKTSLSLTIPIEIIRELGWRNRQKLVVKKRGSGILITDWEK